MIDIDLGWFKLHLEADGCAAVGTGAVIVIVVALLVVAAWVGKT